MAIEFESGVAPVTRRVRAFFAPVDRVSGVPTLFDAAGMAAFDVDAPPPPWLDLGWCSGFVRKSGTKVSALTAGAPGVAISQVRTEIDASVSVEFDHWGKLQMALSGGCQQMNTLAPAFPADALTASSAATTATSLDVGVAAAASFGTGDVVAVDFDYAGQAGFVGSGTSGAYVRSAVAIGINPDYVRCVTLNVARVTAVVDGTLMLGAPLLAGIPADGMKVSRVIGFCDREGGSFFQEWSALFVLEGTQGDRVVFHYPRLQVKSAAEEKPEEMAGRSGFARLRLAGHFRALPVKDPHDGETILCYRSYLPAAMRAV